jgi:tetratricopeptide (TPR) repeat protein
MQNARPDDSRLDLLDAARRLRITPELLVSYVRHGGKGRNGLRLSLVEDGGGNFFRPADLEAYDVYLRSPWVPEDAARPPIPKAVRDYLKVEAGGGCARCIAGTPLEEAHIEAWGVSRSHHHHNLIRLCRNCHRLFDEGVVTRSEIGRLKQACIERVQRRLANTRPQGWPIPSAPGLDGPLVGRDEELSLLAAALTTGRSVLVEGVGGIGKTQLALRALRSVADQRPIVWLGLEGLGSPVEVEDALRRRAAAAGLAPADDLATMLDEGRACLVLDGVERLPDGQDVLADLLDRIAAATSDTLIVVTSQSSLPAFAADLRIRLRPLAREASESLLLQGLEADALNLAHVGKLLRFAEGHPLTIRILSALVRHFGSTADVLTRLKQFSAGAVAMPARRTHTARTSLDLSLAVAFSDLDERQRRLAWAVAMSPAGFRRDMHPLDSLEIGDVVAVAADLRGWNLIEFQRDPTFEHDHPAAVVLTMLSPVRAFVLHRMAAEPREGRLSREKALATQVAFLVSRLQHSFVKKGAAWIGLALLDRELPNALAMFEFARSRVTEDEEFLLIEESLANSTMMLLFTSGRFRLGVQIMRRAAEDVAAAGKTDEAIHFLLQMQVLAERAGDGDNAAFALREAERIGGNAGGEGLAMLRQLQASAAERRGDHRAAAALAEEALALYDALGGEQYQAGFAAFQLGRALEFSGNAEAALPHYRRAIEVWKREDDPINLASTMHHVGNCEAYACRWRSAVDAYREAARGFIELGTVDYISNALGEAGLILPELESMDDLPERDDIRAGLLDAVGRLVDMFDSPELIAERLRVSLRKLGGMMSMAVHIGNADLLEEAADEISEHILVPMLHIPAEQVPEDMKMLVWHVQWLTQLCAFLSIGIGTVPREDELPIIVGFAARGFPVPDHGAMSSWLASFLRRIRGFTDITEAQMRAELDAFEW